MPLETIIASQGYDLHGDDWERTIWGVPSLGLLGRLPMALLEALRHPDCWFHWNTGATAIAGTSEARYTHSLALTRIYDLQTAFPEHFFEFPKSEFTSLKERIIARSLFDEISTNTKTSMQEMRRVLLDNNLTNARVIMVSSENHISRVLLDAMKVFREEDGTPCRHLTLIGVSAHTTYGVHSINDVSVWEKPMSTTEDSR